MAVTALSGQRWQGLSDGAKTPTVANSVFLVDSPTWQEADDISYNSGTDKIDFSADGSSIVDSYATFDLQATSALGSGNNASDTEWVLRFKLDLTNYDAADSSSSALVVGISNQGTSVGSASQNGIGFEVGCGTPHDTLYRLQTANGASWARGSADATFTETPADDEITYVEVKRTSASAVTVNLYSDSEYSTLLESKSITGMSGTTGLRYVAVKSDTQSQPNNRLIGTVSEINFWNDTTSATSAERDSVTDVPVGSEFEQTDDYKSYQYGGYASGLGSAGDILSDTNNTSVASITGTTDPPTFATSSWLASALEVTVKANGLIIPEDSDWTISFWINSTNFATGGSDSPRWLNNNGSDYGIIFEGVDSSPHKLNFQLDKVGGGSITVNFNSGMSINNWYNVVATWDSSAGTFTAYVNYDSATSTTTDAGANWTYPTTGDSWKLGGSAEQFIGYFLDFAVWNKILDGTERTNLYNSGDGVKANTIAKANLVTYYDCQSEPEDQKNGAVGWVERGTAL